VQYIKLVEGFLSPGFPSSFLSLHTRSQPMPMPPPPYVVSLPIPARGQSRRRPPWRTSGRGCGRPPFLAKGHSRRRLDGHRRGDPGGCGKIRGGGARMFPILPRPPQPSSSRGQVPYQVRMKKITASAIICQMTYFWV
jgi:hypothetical protein